MSFNAIFQGPPVNLQAPSATVVDGFDIINNVEYVSNGTTGWIPTSPSVLTKAFLAAQTGAVANVLTYPVLVSGMYRVSTYTVQATATNGTLPVPTAAFTELDLATSSTITTVVTGTATTGAGQSQSGYALVNAIAGTNIVVSTAAPTTLTYNVKARIEFIS